MIHRIRSHFPWINNNPKRFISTAWFFAGIGLTLYALSIQSDEILSKIEILFSFGILFLLFAILSILFLTTPSKRNFSIPLLIFSALAVGGVIWLIFDEQIRPSLHFEQDASIRIDALDGSNTEVQVTWIYWASRPADFSSDPSRWEPVKDFSFSSLETSEGWIFEEDRFLTTKEESAWIHIPTAGLRIHFPVLCIKVLEGNATVTFTNGSTATTVKINSEETSDTPMAFVFSPDTFERLTPFLFFPFFCGVIGFLFICVFYLSARFRKAWRIYLISFLLPCAILTIICYTQKICPFGEKTFLINDMFGEYADYMTYFRSVINGENDLLYSFSKSVGDDFISLLAFYSINPINWLIVLFPREALPYAITLLVIVRFGVCGLTCSIWLHKSGKLGLSAVLFSCCYALMSFNVVNAENTNIREGTLLLPIVLLGIDQIVSGKSAKVYLFALAGTILLNYYSGFQICIFSFIWFCYRLLLTEKTGIRTSLRRFLMASLSAVGIVSFLLIPIIFQLQNGQKTFSLSKFSLELNFSFSELLARFFTGSYDYKQISSDGLPNLFSGFLISISIILFFFNHEITKKEKVVTSSVLAVLFASLSINALNLLWHGLNPPEWWPYRNSFIFTLFFIWLAVRCWTHPKGLRLIGIIFAALFVSTTAVWLLRHPQSFLPQRFILSDLILGASFLLMLFISGKKEKPSSELLCFLGMLCLIDLFSNASQIISINTWGTRSESVSAFQTFLSDNEPVIGRIKEDDPDFYRIEKTYQRNANDAFQLNYNGLSHYSSTLKKTMMDFLPLAGFRYYPFRFIYWEGSTTSMDALFGIRYLLSRTGTGSKPYEPIFDENGITVYRNPDALSIGFAISPEIKNYQAPNGPMTFEMQNALFAGFTGHQFQEALTSATVESPLLHNLTTNNGCFERINKEEPASIEWPISIQNDGILFCMFPTTETHPVEIAINGQAVSPYFDNFSYHVLQLGEYEKGASATVSMALKKEKTCFSSAQFYTENLTQLKTLLKPLQEQQSVLTKKSSSHLTGTISIQKESVLFFSFPYDKGWTVRIDGEKVETYPVADTFLAADISEGEHTLELRFVPRGLRSGIILSVLSLILSIGMLHRQNKQTHMIKIDEP